MIIFLYLNWFILLLLHFGLQKIKATVHESIGQKTQQLSSDQKQRSLNPISLRGGGEPILARTWLILVYISGWSGPILYDHMRGRHAWMGSHEHESANNIWYTGAQAKWIRFNKIYLYPLTVD